MMLFLPRHRIVRGMDPCSHCDLQERSYRFNLDNSQVPNGRSRIGTDGIRQLNGLGDLVQLAEQCFNVVLNLTLCLFQKSL